MSYTEGTRRANQSFFFLKTIKLYFRNIHWYIVKREIDTDRISLFTMPRTRECECVFSPFLFRRIVAYHVYNSKTTKNHQPPAPFVHTLNTCVQLRPHVHIPALLYVRMFVCVYSCRRYMHSHSRYYISDMFHRLVSREAQPPFEQL